MNKTFTTKDSEETNIQDPTSKKLIGSFLQFWSNQGPILNIACTINSLRPKILRQVILTQHGSCHFLKSPIFPLNNSILLRGPRSREIVSDSMHIIILMEVLIGKLSAIITPKTYQFHTQFIF